MPNFWNDRSKLANDKKSWFTRVLRLMLRFLASSSRAKKALSLILKDLVTVFSGTFDQTLEPNPPI